MTFQKCRFLIFFKVTFFRKVKKSGIPSVSNSLDPDHVQCVLGPVFGINVKPDPDPKLFWLTLADEELTGFFIFAALYLL